MQNIRDPYNLHFRAQFSMKREYKKLFQQRQILKQKLEDHARSRVTNVHKSKCFYSVQLILEHFFFIKYGIFIPFIQYLIYIFLNTCIGHGILIFTEIKRDKKMQFLLDRNQSLYYCCRNLKKNEYKILEHAYIRQEELITIHNCA